MTQAHTEFEAEYEAEDEFETELEDEFETEDEDEAFLGALGGIARSLLSETEDEYEFEDEYEAEDELEGEFEDEFEAELESEFEFEDEYEDEFEDEDEAFLGALGGIARSFLGGGDGEYEFEDEAELEEEAEAFLKGVGRFFKRNKNTFRFLAKKLGPIVATAVGGPAAGALARAVTSQLEGEFEAELEAELEEMGTAPVTSRQALGEYLAARAASTESESEAEAFAGSAVTLAVSESERRQLDAMLPHLLRGAAILTRALHRNPASRQGVRLVPGIVDTAARTLVNRAAGGPVGPADVGAVLGSTTRRVLGDPRWQYAGARRHARGLAQARRLRRYGGVGYRRGRYGRGYRPGYRGGRGTVYRAGGGTAYRAGRRPARPGVRRAPLRQTIRRTPMRVRTVSPNARVPRPRPGVVRVVTPVRVPARGGVPARTVRVVSDVKVPRGAVPAGRPVGLAGRKR